MVSGFGKVPHLSVRRFAQTAWVKSQQQAGVRELELGHRPLVSARSPRWPVQARDQPHQQGHRRFRAAVC